MNEGGQQPQPVCGSLTLDQVRAALAEHEQLQRTAGATRPFHDLNCRGFQLDGIEASEAIFERCDFSKASLKRAVLPGAKFKDCVFQQADFTSANLFDARFEWGEKAANSSMYSVILVDADASHAHFLGADMREARAARGRFDNADFSGSNLAGADFSFADLLDVRGASFDKTITYFARFSPLAGDPWSTLRRTYTGPRFAVIFLLFVLFVATLAGKAFALYGLALVEQATGTLHAATQFCEATDACQTTSLIAFMSGYNQGGFAFIFVLFSLAYNAVRFAVTLLVSLMRDAEERSGVSPPRAVPGREPERKGPWLIQRLLTSYGWIWRVHRGFLQWASWVSFTLFVLGMYDILSTRLILPDPS